MNLEIGKSPGETELIQGCCKNSMRHQRALYDKHSGRMLSVCLRYVKDQSEAEGIMIEGFMKIYENIKQYQGSGSFEGWMRKIMVNQSLTYLRKNKGMYLETDLDMVDGKADLNYMEEHLHETDLLTMIQELPVGYRTVFNLYAIEGYSHKEIAQTLNINVNTSKSQLSRARIWLQRELMRSEEKLKKISTGYEG